MRSGHCTSVTFCIGKIKSTVSTIERFVMNDSIVALYVGFRKAALPMLSYCKNSLKSLEMQLFAFLSRLKLIEMESPLYMVRGAGSPILWVIPMFLI